MNRLVTALFVISSVVFGAHQASAQGAPWSDRGYINVGWGVESGSSAMTDTRTSTIYEETATVDSAATFSSGSLFDVGVGVRVWRNLTVGAGYHQEQNDTEGKLTGSIPSPVFFNQPRTLNETVPGLNRKESAVHLVFGWVVPLSSKFDVMVSGGPSFFRVEQDAVSAVSIGETGGSFTTILAQPTITTSKKSQTGFNAGVDATYIVWENDSVRLGAGAFARFTRADVTLPMLASEQSTEVGGMQFGFGARVRF